MFLGITGHDWLVFWQYFCIAIAWFVVLVYLVSGAQDLVYDVWNLAWRAYRRLHFAKRERLTLERLRMRDQQRIAVLIPAWQEAAVVDKMVENILHRVEYRRYTLFVGTYPNDAETQRAVDVLAAAHPEVVKVVTSRPGPTNKADCLNHVFEAVKKYEEKHAVSFDVLVMHDAEDVVHPYSFLLYNYLIPRVDAVQLPILPLPMPSAFSKWTHWVYADEFAENHMKDVVVREKMGGFVPFAGVGTGFSRRAFTTLAMENNGEIFNEFSLTEDYSTAKKMRDAGLKSIFVNVVLGDDNAPWYTPLAQRKSFIANWSYFPFTFARSVRQKTRWIIGISLQEWEHSGWKGNLLIKENLIKDRKGFVSFASVFLGYSLFLYFIVYELGQRQLVPLQLLPIIHKGSILYSLVLVDTIFMFVRASQRILWVSAVYGVLPGVLSIPRLFYGNIINGLASFRALKYYLQSRRGNALRWDKTDHQEGVGAFPVDTAVNETPQAEPMTCIDFVSVLASRDTWEIITALNELDAECTAGQREDIIRLVNACHASDDHHIRAVTARVVTRLGWPELQSKALELLFDQEWIVRANAARALLHSPRFMESIGAISQAKDRYAWEIFVKTIESDEHATHALLTRIGDAAFDQVRETLLAQSPLLTARYREQLETAGQDKGGIPVGAVADVATV